MVLVYACGTSHRILQLRFGLNEIEEVTFVQQSAEAYQYRDAVRFQNGHEILLQRLRCGQQVEVLSLAADDFPEKGRRWIEKVEGNIQPYFRWISPACKRSGKQRALSHRYRRQRNLFLASPIATRLIVRGARDLRSS